MKQAFDWYRHEAVASESPKLISAQADRLAEPGGDARELVDKIFDRHGITATVGAPSACSFDEHFRRDFAAIIERHVAAQVAKAREEERERVENAVRSWMLRGQYGGVDALIATIKEAPDGTN